MFGDDLTENVRRAICICKENLNIISNSFKKFSCKLSRCQKLFNLPRQEKELCSPNQSPKGSTQDNTGSPSITQLDVSDLEIRSTQKVKNLFSAGFVSTQFSKWKDLTSDTEICEDCPCMQGRQANFKRGGVHYG